MLASTSTALQIDSCSKDPIGYQPVEYNLYSYVASSPLLFVDNSGHRKCRLAIALGHVCVDRQVLYIHRGKGQKDRYVPIGLRALTWIARYVEQARDELCVEPGEQNLFLTVDGSPLKPDSLTEYARRYIKHSGVNKPGACHVFRHSMATAMHDHGADIRTIQAILGHERLDTTQIYTRVGLKKLLETHAQTHPAERDEGTEPAS